jgi:hypothetical protein
MLEYSRNPNNYTDKYLKEMHWPKHDSFNEFYLDIGTHLTEKNGLFLDRYKVWEEWDKNSSNLKSASFISIMTIIFLVLIRWKI